tara:strand:- start:538 stop:708 length:171 start_codon:yes stop_codon:yes gene_type:complete
VQRRGGASLGWSLDGVYISSAYEKNTFRPLPIEVPLPLKCNIINIAKNARSSAYVD